MSMCLPALTIEWLLLACLKYLFDFITLMLQVIYTWVSGSPGFTFAGLIIHRFVISEKDVIFFKLYCQLWKITMYVD